MTGLYSWKQPGAVGQSCTVARCKACQRKAMVPESMDAMEAALSLRNLGRDECAMVCTYCGAKQKVTDRVAIDYALMHGDAVRERWRRELAAEREKVARLAEGRW